eukprot:scaffold88921_cov20-Tisochrysis_lutea.AAC.4
MNGPASHACLGASLHPSYHHLTGRGGGGGAELARKGEGCFRACHDMSMHAVGNGHTLEGLVCPWGHAVSMHTVEGAHSGGCAPYPE